MRLPFFSQGLTCDLGLEQRLGQELLQPAVLCTELLQPLGVRHVHPTELAPPQVDRCVGCGQTFSSTKGTPYYRLQHRRATFDTVVALRVEGVSLSAIARVEGLAWNTVARGLERAAAGCRRFSHGRVAGFVVEELQADEIRSFTGGKRRPPWIFAAMEGVVSPAAEVAHVSSQKF